MRTDFLAVVGDRLDNGDLARLAFDSEVGISEIARVIEYDQVITANVLHWANSAWSAQLEETLSNFSADDYRGVYFVVHSPDSSLASAVDLPEHVVVMPPEVLAEQAVDAGLIGWLEDKVR